MGSTVCSLPTPARRRWRGPARVADPGRRRAPAGRARRARSSRSGTSRHAGPPNGCSPSSTRCATHRPASSRPTPTGSPVGGARRARRREPRRDRAPLVRPARREHLPPGRMAGGHDYAAYDPFDGLDSWVRPLAVTPFSRQVLQQGVRRFPWNLRPLLGISPATSTKAVGYTGTRVPPVVRARRRASAPGRRRRMPARGSSRTRARATRDCAGAITSTTSRGSSTCRRASPR